MSAAFKFRIEKEVYHVACKTGADDSPAEAKGVRIVVKPCEARAECVGTAGSADAGYFVRGDADADARTANQDRACTASVFDR